MAAPAVAAVAKKVIVYILTDKKALKTVLGIVLGIIIILLLPLGVIIGVLNGDVEIDPDRMQELIVQNLSAEEQAMLQSIEDTMYGIEDGMTNAGYSGTRVTEAQVLYVLALSSYSSEDGFVDKLVGCFTQDQSDEQLISAVNSAFGTSITTQDFSNVMSNIRNAYIDTSNYTDPNTKNSTDLVLWAENAADKGWGYVYGTYGTVLSESMLNAKMEQYPDEVATKEQFIRDTWLGKRTADCVGLIKGYYHFGVDVNDTNGNGKALAEALKKRDEIAELIMTEDCIEINFHLQYCDNCQSGNPASVLSLIGCNIYDEHLGHAEHHEEESTPSETPKLKVAAYGEEFELIPEVTLFLVPDFMGTEQLNLGINLYTKEDNGFHPFAVLTKSFGEFIGQKNCAYIDTNNCPFADQLLAQGIAIDTGLTKQSGFCTYPLWQFNEDFLKSADSEHYKLYSEGFDAYMESMNPSEDEGQTFGM